MLGVFNTLGKLGNFRRKTAVCAVAAALSSQIQLDFKATLSLDHVNEFLSRRETCGVIVVPLGRMLVALAEQGRGGTPTRYEVLAGFSGDIVAQSVD